MLSDLSETIQLDRLIQRDNLTSVEAFQRMTSQMSIERKAMMADVVIDNSGSITDTEQQLDAWVGISGFQPVK